MNGYSTQLALFQTPKIESGILKEEFIEYRPTGHINTGSIVEFFIPGTAAQYYDLRKSRLNVKVKILKANGTAVTATDNVGFVNLSLSALFRQVDIMLNQNTISNDVGVNYPWKSYIDVLLNYGHDVKETLLQSELYYKDSANYMDETDCITGSNSALLQRYTWTKDGNSVALEGPLHHDLCQMNRLVLNGVPIHLKLYPSLDVFRLMTGTEEKYKVEIEDIVFRVCQVTIDPKIIVIHNELLEKNDAVYPFWKSIIRTYGIAEKSFTFSCEDILNGVIPSKVIVGLVASEAYAGSYKKNPFNFINADLNYLELMINGSSTPGRALQPNYTKKDYITEYNSIFFNQYPPHGGNFIHRDEYPNGYCLYCFDVESQLGGDVMGQPRNGQTRLTARFSKELPFPVTVIIYCAVSSVMKIDKARNVYA